jgi:flagellar hook protein FlgE
MQPDGTMGSQVGNLMVAGGTIPANPSTAVDMSIQLDSNAVSPAAWDPTDPEGTSNFSTSVTTYDSLGNAHETSVYFRKSGANAWEWHAMVDGGELTGGAAGSPTEIATGTLGFTAGGALDVETPGAASADFLGAQAGQALAGDFGDAITTDGGTGLSGTTQFAGASSVAGVDQDGYAPGTLVDVSVADDGTITGVFSNGQSRPVAQVALAHFASDAGLRRAGSQLFSQTRDSGQAVLGAPGTGGAGSISASSLESSNVDLGTELVTLIAYQRAFQASARTITTADEMLAEVANLKR